MSKQNYPAIEIIASEFSSVIRTWLNPGQMREVIKRNREQNTHGKFCATHDFCDANMAMSEALTNLGVSVFSGPDGTMEDSVMALWGDAWDMAKKNEFRRTLERTEFGTFAPRIAGEQVTGFLNGPNTIEMYTPGNKLSESIPTGYGFDVIEREGGGTAWSQDFLIDGEKVRMLVSNGQTHEVKTFETVTVEVFGEDGHRFYAWTQANFPLDKCSLPTFINVWG